MFQPIHFLLLIFQNKCRSSLLILLALGLLGPVANAQAQMSGTYTVGVVNSTGNAFAGLSAAISALAAQGVSGPVLLSLTADANTPPGMGNGNNGGNYGFGEMTPIVIPAIVGASPTNTITIKPAPGVNATITTSDLTSNSALNFNGADYFIVDGSNQPNGTSSNLFITNTNTVPASGAVAMRLTSASSTDGATNNTFRSIKFLSSNNLSSNNLGGILVTGDGNNNNRFENNTIQQTAIGLSIVGTAGSPSTGNTIINNFIGTSRATASSSFVTKVGITVSNAPGVEITSNTLFNIDQTSSYNVRAIEVSGACSGALVSRNRIRSVNNDFVGPIGFGASAIVLDTDGSTGVRVINNVMSDITAVGGPGIEGRAAGITVLSGTGIAIYNNSVQIDGTQLSVQPAAALVVANGVTGLDVRNNIFSNIRTTGTPPVNGDDYAVLVEDGAPNPFAIIDYNMYDVRASAPQYIGRLGMADAATLADWRTATGQDRSSMTTAGYQAVGVSPLPIAYRAGQDLRPDPTVANNHSLSSTGVQLPGVVLVDIDGTPRPTAAADGAPDLGAYEFTPTATRPALEAGPEVANAQPFYFFGRPLVELAYPAGGVRPAGLAVTYFPGVPPPSPLPTTALYQRAHFTITAGSPGDGYLSQTLHYEPALLGTILLASEQRIARQTAGGYRTDPATVVDLAARTLTASTAPGALLEPFGLFTIVDNLAPLPVELTGFAAVRQGDDAALSWATASEQNNQGFEVQVSTDGRDFRTLGFVAGAGTCTTPRHYRYLHHPAATAGLRYYRLRQLDADGTASISPVRTLLFGAGAARQADHFEVAPNPLRGTDVPTLYVTAGQPQPGTQLTVVDALGRPVLARTLDLDSGLSTQPLPGLAQLPAGLYTVRLTCGGRATYQKLVKQ